MKVKLALVAHYFGSNDIDCVLQALLTLMS